MTTGRHVDTIKAQLAGYAAQLGFDHLDDATVHAAKVRVIETLGALPARDALGADRVDAALQALWKIDTMAEEGDVPSLVAFDESR